VDGWRPSRRDFLGTALALGAGTAWAAPRGGRGDRGDQRVLVVLHLAGGNDGLNTVVPYADDAYHRARPSLALRAREVWRLDAQLGLHPALSPLRAAWDRGELAWVLGTGAVTAGRSHLSACERWEQGGWLSGAVTAPLAQVAQRIAAGDRTAVYRVGCGGFDTHARQAAAHAALLGGLASDLARCAEALRASGHWRRTLVLGWSEFGRALAENANYGTDHGGAGPLFLLGGAVRGGLHGRQPRLTDLGAGGLPVMLDQRAVQATVLARWCGGDPRAVWGREFPRLDLLRV
jgi:uncharacterized protein (DUF1501 family)